MGGTTSPVSVAFELGLGLTSTITMNQTNVRVLAGVSTTSGASWSMNSLYGRSNGTLYGIFMLGSTTVSGYVSAANYVTSSGVIGADTGTSATARVSTSACTYGSDKGIFIYGTINNYSSGFGFANRVSNTGAVSSDAAVSGSARTYSASCGYGGDKGITIFGTTGLSNQTATGVTNLISNTGVVGADVAAVVASRAGSSACTYGGSKGISAFGAQVGTFISAANLISDTGIPATDTSTIGTARTASAACSYGGDKGIFGFGFLNGGFQSTFLNLVTNTGAVGADFTVAGSAGRAGPSACGYGRDKGIFALGTRQSAQPNNFAIVYNTVSNTGTVSSDTSLPAGITKRAYPSACGYGT